MSILCSLCPPRLDAKKLLVRYRRPIPQNARDIGIWLDIMSTLTRLAVITNAFIIAITSDFIPGLVYSTTVSDTGDLRGFVNFTLSYLDTGDLDRGGVTTNTTGQPQVCRYPGFYNPPDSEDEYGESPLFWQIWCFRILFVVVFQTVVSVTLMVVRYMIPNIPTSLRDRIRSDTQGHLILYCYHRLITGGRLS